ncbi:chromate resistance protein ChrB domain-containing protein [Hymenobacter lapidarius]|uniref:chromate resistance protein ChrB domain-containing protein n=1 Tax=Hymenobacter lapidarius TaxID=1908237 RepID=UPI001EFAB27C|nr:chromate resistance protein ChrB domain-containing protein [Hymenobacter lapidarius]
MPTPSPGSVSLPQALKLVQANFPQLRARQQQVTVADNRRRVIQAEALLPAIPYDIPGAEYSHEGDRCTFDFILKKHNLTDPALRQLALIVRGADTDHFELAPQAAGLWAISTGLSYNHADDAQQLAIGLHLYEALYSWAKHGQAERHTWTPS